VEGGGRWGVECGGEGGGWRMRTNLTPGLRNLTSTPMAPSELLQKALLLSSQLQSLKFYPQQTVLGNAIHQLFVELYRQVSGIPGAQTSFAKLRPATPEAPAPPAAPSAYPGAWNRGGPGYPPSFLPPPQQPTMFPPPFPVPAIPAARNPRYIIKNLNPPSSFILP
jgi:hypothetical protein